MSKNDPKAVLFVRVPTISIPSVKLSNVVGPTNETFQETQREIPVRGMSFVSSPRGST